MSPSHGNPELTEVDGIARRQSMESLAIPQTTPAKHRPSVNRGPLQSTRDDDFGDFATNQDVFEEVDFGDFAKPASILAPHTQMKEMSLLDFDDVPLPSRPLANGHNNRTSGFFAFNPPSSTPSKSTPGPAYLAYKHHHLSLKPLCHHLRSSPSPTATLGLLFPATTSLSHQSQILLSLLLFLSPRLQPFRDWGYLRQALLAAADRFDSTCLVAFEMADSKDNEVEMKLAAMSSWNVWDAGGGGRDQWECGRVWVERREVFYETGKWDPAENIAYVIVKVLELMFAAKLPRSMVPAHS